MQSATAVCCDDLCPLSELPTRPPVFEQWSAAQVQRIGCKHALPAAEVESLRRRSAASTDRSSRASRGVSRSNDTLSPPSAPFLTPIAPYRRTAHSSEQELASQQRSLTALQAAVDHLLHCVLSRTEDGQPFATRAAYVSDRLRQVKKELVMSCLVSSRPVAALELLARSLRFHLLAGWLLLGEQPARFDAKMNADRAEDYCQAIISACTMQSTA